MKIVREKVLALYGLINHLSSLNHSVKFHYLMLKNKTLLQGEVDSLQKAQTPSEEYLKIDKERVALCERFATKDEAGKCLTQPDSKGNEIYVMTSESKKLFEDEIAKFKEDHKDIIGSFEQQKKDFQELLKEEVEIDFHKIPVDLLPEKMVGREVELLFDFIEED
jgi:hypothetical protein